MAETLSHSAQQPLITPHTAEVLFYRGLAGFSVDEAAAQLLTSLVRELRRGPDELRRSVMDRFHVWLDLEPGDAAHVVAAYDRAHDQLTPEQQVALDEAEREVVLNGLTFDEFERLAEFVPWLRAWNVARPPRRPVSGPPAPFGLSLAMLRN